MSDETTQEPERYAPTDTTALDRLLNERISRRKAISKMAGLGIGVAAVAVAGGLGYTLLNMGGSTAPAPSTSTSTVASTTTSTATTQTITDQAGRVVTIPTNVERIVTLHPLATQAVWRLAPNKLMNIDRVFQSRISTFLCPDADLTLLKSLPVTGVYFDPPSQEQVASLKPDLIITLLGDTNVNNYQQTYGCPAIVGNKATLNAYSSTFQMIGQAVGNPSGGSQLSTYWDGVIDRVTAYTTQVPLTNRLKVYYGSHNALLTTPGTSTIMSSILDLAGTIGFSTANPSANIAPSNESGTVSLEQLLAWNPDVIVVTNGNLVPQVTSNSQWENMNAVINNQVFANPVEETFDGTNCLMGLVWISTMLYPKTVQLDFLTEVQNYYSLFNKYSITQAQTQLPGQGW